MPQPKKFYMYINYFLVYLQYYKKVTFIIFISYAKLNLNGPTLWSDLLSTLWESVKIGTRDVKGTGQNGTGQVPSRPARDGRDWDSKIIFSWDGTGLGPGFEGQPGQQGIFIFSKKL